MCQFEGSPLAGADEAGRSSLTLCQECVRRGAERLREAMKVHDTGYCVAVFGLAQEGLRQARLHGNLAQRQSGFFSRRPHGSPDCGRYRLLVVVHVPKIAVLW